MFSLAEIESVPEPQLAAVQEFDAGARHALSDDLSVSLARWPGAARFALFLSHDVDQIHDRELFRLLADVNHVRRCCFNGENGNVRLALRRIGRSLLRPKAATGDFETLVELGYRVLEAEDGHIALRLLEREPGVRLLFTDVGLPGGLNGSQLADQARQRRPDLKVLFTTGYARDAIIHDGRLDPGVVLIAKPFSFAAIAEKLRDVLDAAVA